MENRDYLDYPEHMQRVYKEHKELQEKIDKLELFIETKTFSNLEGEDKDLLLGQIYHMERYNDILIHRLK